MLVCRGSLVRYCLMSPTLRPYMPSSSTGHIDKLTSGSGLIQAPPDGEKKLSGMQRAERSRCCGMYNVAIVSLCVYIRLTCPPTGSPSRLSHFLSQLLNDGHSRPYFRHDSPLAECGFAFPSLSPIQSHQVTRSSSSSTVVSENRPVISFWI